MLVDISPLDELEQFWDVGNIGIGAIPNGFGIEVELKIALPGLASDIAESLVEKAHIVCPYSNATRGNSDIHLKVV